MSSCGGHDGHDGQGQNEKRQCQNRHYNINILFIYSEQMTESDIDFDQNDHDHDDHGEPVFRGLCDDKVRELFGSLMELYYLCTAKVIQV